MTINVILFSLMRCQKCIKHTKMKILYFCLNVCAHILFSVRYNDMISTEIDFRFILRETKKLVVTEVKGNLDNVMRTLCHQHIYSASHRLRHLLLSFEGSCGNLKTV